ncbi:MAG TPA: DoxX family protein [Mariprofundaceae bacterium]|nr:DoxX family protein [Mariprofundaceae bacterium]
MNKLTVAIARILMSQIFIISGISKIHGYAATQGYMAHYGVPGALLPLVILTELGGGLLLLVGFKARIAAFLLAGFSVLAAAIFHMHFTEPMQTINFMKDLAIAGGLLLVVSHGAGEPSVDAYRKR